jgi:hypothetical protein
MCRAARALGWIDAERKGKALLHDDAVLPSCAGFDPRIHQPCLIYLAKMMGCRVKPGNDESEKPA